jgi:epoxyqueuosine reductase
MAENGVPGDASARVRERARSLGFSLVGFGEAAAFTRERDLFLEHLASGYQAGMAWITSERVRLSCDPDALVPGARTIIGLGTAYGGGSPARPPGPMRGRVARYAWGRDYHDLIPPRLRALADFLKEVGGPETRSRIFVDTGPLLDRAAAERAGIGFVGKNTCLLTGRHGSFVFLSAIVTTALLPGDPLISRDCGSCRACLDACPTGAFVAPRVLDARRCISYLTIEHRGSLPRDLRPALGSWVFGCDVCQDVCPWNHGRPAASADDFAPAAGAGQDLDLLEILRLDEAAFRVRFRGTPLTRAKRVGLLRNAAVALGNGHDPAAVSALVGALTDVEPVVREHAAWALSQLRPLPADARLSLERQLAVEEDAAARCEIELALTDELSPER